MDKKNVIIKLIMCFFVSFAWMNIGGLESTNILLLCVFMSFFVICRYRDIVFASAADDESKVAGVSLKRIKNTSYILSALFTISYACFADLTGGLENRAFIFIYVAFGITGLFFMFDVLLEIAIFKTVEYMGVKKNLTRNAFSWKLMLLYSGIIYICCIPFFALNFPGVLTVDSLNQLGQVMGIIDYSNHHPWIHTKIISLFYNIGYGITGSAYIGIACYTVFQILMVGLSVGYSLECLYEAGISKAVRNVLLICFIMLPYNLMYAITMWKDILFTMAVLVFTITVVRICKWDQADWNEAPKAKYMRDKVLFVICGFAMCVLRHNGLYAFTAAAAIWLIIRRKTLKTYMFLSIAILFAAILCRGPLMRACGVEPGKYVYNMCMPLQQVGRVVAMGEEIPLEQTEWLEKVNTLDYIRAGFDIQCADPMFAWVIDGDEEFFDSHKSEFITLWLKMGIKHPISYIRAFIDLTKGYWTPMNPQQTVYFGMSDNDLSLYPKPVMEGPALIKINELLTKLYGMIPIYGLFYSMGSFLWIMLMLMAVCICKKEYGKIFAFLPVFMLTLTLLIATPLVADMRYSYALFVILPYQAVYVLGIGLPVTGE